MSLFQGDPGFLGEPGDMGVMGKQVHIIRHIMINNINVTMHAIATATLMNHAMIEITITTTKQTPIVKNQHLVNKSISKDLYQSSSLEMNRNSVNY